MQKCPSFLVLRNGIFYFQARIPAHLRHCFPVDQHYLVRRSTGTGNRREAIGIARKWFVDLTTKYTKDLAAIDARIEREAAREEWLYDTGKKLFYERVDHLHPDDSFARARATDDLTSDELEALAFYEDYRADLYPAGARVVEGRGAVHDNALPKAKPAEPGKTLDALVPIYFHQSGSSWTLKTQDKFRQQILLFCEMVGNPPLSQLSKDLVRDQFSHRIKKWPKNVSTKAKFFTDFSQGKRRTVEEILAIRNSDGDEVIGPSTVNDYCKNVLSFLNWLRDESYIDRDFSSLFKTARKEAARQQKCDREFSSEDLKRLFENEYYRRGELMNKPHWHWSPLLALFTGARESEICQLHLEDILFDADLDSWVVDFNAKGPKQLKTVYSARAVPVHPMLIELGFIEYFRSMRSRGEKQLFAGAKPDKYGHWGRSVSRWFNGYNTAKGRVQGFKEKCGIDEGEGTRKDFHSFRHTLINYGKQSAFDTKVIREITGHATDTDVHSKVYEKLYEMTERKKVIEKIAFDIDFSKIRRWK